MLLRLRHHNEDLYGGHLCPKHLVAELVFLAKLCYQQSKAEGFKCTTVAEDRAGEALEASQKCRMSMIQDLHPLEMKRT